MKVQYLRSADYLPRGGGNASPAKNRRDNGLFWWTIVITLLMGLATFCWFFSIMVFRYPEKPFNYQILAKLEKLETLKKFDPLEVPIGKFNGSRELLAKYYNYNEEQLRHANDTLKRAYITNYENEAPVYVRGTFTVVNARALSENDFVNQGWVVRARSTELEDVEVEVLLPGAQFAEAPFIQGDSLLLDNKKTFGTVLHVTRDKDTDGLCATVMPISYGEYSVSNQRVVDLAPPGILNMEAAFPLTKAVPLESQVALQMSF